jgi:calcineurin-like phosphoesterase family protein
MIKIKDEVKVFVTSDSHYGHKNLCRGVSEWISSVHKEFNEGKLTNSEYKVKIDKVISQTRPFDTIEQMNNAIVKGINDTVGQDDVIIHFGDWSFGGLDNIQIFWDRLICKNIHLFYGNHDHHILNNRSDLQRLFLSVRHYGEIQYRGETIVGMHDPITSWDGLRKGRIHLHGHCHLPNDKKISKNGRRMDVGFDGHPQFKPYDLYRDCIVPLKKLPIGSELGNEDHHADLTKNIVG